jgi:hypothetical protein
LDDPSLWKIACLIILVAVIGKFFGSALAARFVGQSWKDSLTIGALMNTRGLVELVVLNIGYDLGVLTPEIFTMMVVMALITTMMTGPALDFINYVFKEKSDPISTDIIEATRYKVLLAFGNPQTGRSLLKLANSFTKKLNGNAMLTAMHLSPASELHHYNVDEYEQQSFAPVLQESKTIGQKITTLFKASSDIESDISEIANKGNFDLLLMGVGQSIFEGSLLGKILGFTTGIINPDHIISKVTGREKLFDNSPFDERTRMILLKTTIPVGIYIDKQLASPDKIFIPVVGKTDEYLLDFAQKFISNCQSQVVIIDLKGQVNLNAHFKERIRMIEQTAPNHIAIVSEKNPDNDFLKSQDLMLISADAWRQLLERKTAWLPDIPSTLIISHK